MKNIVATILLSTIVFQLFGFVPVYRIMQYQSKQRMENRIGRGISANEKTIFSLSELEDQPTFSWKENRKEFEYQGALYDVVSIKNNTIICIKDKNENKIIAQLEKYIKQLFSKSADKKNEVNLIGNVFFALYICPSPLEFKCIQSRGIQTIFYHTEDPLYHTDSPSLLRPPLNA